jgi:digeranylgeranylglycerophospholipid reductase
MNDFDVLVVGAGPGGSIAAKQAAENGYKTCLLEKEKISIDGRYKACGGAIAKELFEEIDYPEEKLSRKFNSLELHHTNGEDFSKKGEGAVIWRNVFDKYLSDIAVKSGAKLKDNEALVEIDKIDDLYKITTKKNTFLAKYVIAADGVTSQTLKKLDWPYFSRENLILTITKEMKTTAQSIKEKLGDNSIHAFFGIKDLITVGYAWLFPKAETITVGWGNQINLIKNSREEFKIFISLPFVKKALIDSELSIFQPHLIPVGLRPLIYKENVFAVGDSGGIVDPISGKGIPYAMMSGQIAVDTIKYCEQKGKPDKLGIQYEKRLDRKFLRILKAKRVARDKIFQSDESLIRFLTLWEKYRSSEIVMRKLI